MSEQQTVLKTPWWKNKKIIIRIIVTAVLVVVVFIVLITAAQTFHWQTGFTSSQKTTTTTEVTQPSGKKVTTTIEDQPAKTLWDWLPLLIQLFGALAIPVVVGLGAAYISKRQSDISETNRTQQHDTEMQIAEIQQQEELLRTYFDKISELVLNKELSTSPNIQSIVRARTLAVLRMLNTERKAIILRFLHDSSIAGDSNLLQYVKSFLYSLDLSHTDLNRIDLHKADLTRVNLSYAKLNRADLSGADLSGANLTDADLWGANLSGAKLNRADLSGATLRGADLSGAGLFEANLTRVNLNRADLSGADLWGANLTGADLSIANLTGANLSIANLTGAKLWDANFSGAKLSSTIATPEQFTKAKNITGEQLAQIIGDYGYYIFSAESVATPERKLDQTIQEDAEQQEHKQTKQDPDY